MDADIAANLAFQEYVQQEELEKLQAKLKRCHIAMSNAIEIIKDSYGEDQVANGDCQACNVLQKALEETQP